ncbi:MAG: hypothetical protein ACOCWO_06045 [Candidatus Muiribacteriaceae bacterium]
MKRFLILILSIVMIFMTISMINAQETDKEEKMQDLPLYLEYLDQRGISISRGIREFNRLERGHKVSLLTWLASVKDRKYDYAVRIREDYEEENKEDLFGFLYRNRRAGDNSFPPPFIRFVSDGAHPTFQNSIYVFLDAPHGYRINVYRMMYDFQYMKPELVSVRRGYHRISGLEAGERYIFKAVCSKDKDIGSNFRELEVTTYPGPPQNLGWKTEGKTGWADFRLKLMWDKVPGAEKYEIRIDGTDKVWTTEKTTITVSDPYISVFNNFPVTVESIPGKDFYLNDTARSNALSVVYIK